MYSIYFIFTAVIIFVLTNLVLIINGITYSDRYDYDTYGIRIASTNYFVVLAENNAFRYAVSFVPFGPVQQCTYNYSNSNDFIISIAAGRRQNFSQLSFVYLKTNTTDGQYQTLGLFTFSNEQQITSPNHSCSNVLRMGEGAYDVKEWKREPSELSTLQVDLYGKYAYGFLSRDIFIYDIENKSVKSLSWKDVFRLITLKPHALDISQTNDGTSIAIVAGYYNFDIDKTLPAVYLVRLNPPYNMTLMDNYTLSSSNQKFIRERYVSTYLFDYVLSVSIHDSTQQVLVGVPCFGKTYLFSFNSTNLILMNSFNRASRSITWFDDNDAEQAWLLLSDTATLPWSKSQVQALNISSNDTLYAYPNNQQTLEQWSNTPPTFIRLTRTYNHQLAILTTDGIIVLVPSIDAGYYLKTDDINAPIKLRSACPRGTYKSQKGPIPCTICPTMTKSSWSGKNYLVLFKI